MIMEEIYNDYQNVINSELSWFVTLLLMSIALLLADYITGVGKALKLGKSLESGKFKVQIGKTFTYVGALIMGVVCDLIINVYVATTNDPDYLWCIEVPIVLYLFFMHIAITELKSLTENIGFNWLSDTVDRIVNSKKNI